MSCQDGKCASSAEGGGKRTSLNKSMHTAEAFFGQIVMSMMKHAKNATNRLNALQSIIKSFTKQKYNQDWCQALDDHQVEVPKCPDKPMGGTAGVVGDMYRVIDGKPYLIRILDNQLFHNGLAGAFDPYVNQVVVKRTLPQTKGKLLNNVIVSSDAIQLPDPFYEVFANCILNMYYTAGMMPHITKMYGFYGCNVGNHQSVYYLVSEKNDHTLTSWMKNAKGTPEDTKQLLGYIWQILYTLMVAKRVCGYRHLDLHCGNVMVQHLAHYQGLEDFKTIVYHGDNKKGIQIPALPYIAKIIDQGMGSIVFGDFVWYHINENAQAFANQIRGAFAASNPKTSRSGFVQVDAVHFLLNVAHNTCNLPQWRHNADIAAIIQQLTQYIRLPPTLNVKGRWPSIDGIAWGNNNGEHLAGKNIWSLISGWYFRTDGKCLQSSNIKLRGNTYNNSRAFFGTDAVDKRGVEITESYFVDLALPYLRNHFTSAGGSSNASTVHLYSTIEAAKAAQKYKLMNQDEKLLSIVDKCVRVRPHKECPSMLRDAFKWTNTSLLQQSLVGHELQHAFSPTPENGIEYQYKNLATTIVAKDYKWFDQTVHRGTKVFDNAINTHILFVKNQYDLAVHIGKDLYTVAKQTLKQFRAADKTPKSFFVVNGNYFIVDSNIQDPLERSVDGAKLVAQSRLQPIGFLYANPKVYPALKKYHTVLEIPQGYHANFAAIGYNASTSEWTFMPYTDFVKQFATKPTKQTIQFIKSGKKQQLTTVTVDPSAIPFDLVFSAGPILVQNAKPVFDANEVFKVDNKEYKVVSYAKDANKFRSLSSTDNKMPYGQRHSNYLVNQNVMLFMEDGSIGFMLVEGRGFDSIGIQRQQMLEQCMKIKGLKHAVSLDGGFSANIVMYDATYKPKVENLRFAMNDPEKRELGLSLQFIRK